MLKYLAFLTFIVTLSYSVSIPLSEEWTVYKVHHFIDSHNFLLSQSLKYLFFLFYKATHQKKYESPTEDLWRMEIFLKNLQMVNKHNERFDRGEETYSMAINQFSDRLPGEISKGLLNGVGFNSHSAIPFKKDANFVLPDSVDWRERGAVTPVKAQGECSSCWAFSATGSLEGHHFIKTGKLVSLSESNLVDCSTKNGCGGGSMSNAFEYIIENQGIDTEESYPYHAREDECRFNSLTVGATMKSYVNITIGDELELAEAVAKYGPVSVGIATSAKFGHYRTGVLNDDTCGDIDHGVTVVGYGTENGTDFWLVKNSWGKGFGDRGYIKMSRNRNSQCKIADMASYPVL